MNLERSYIDSHCDSPDERAALYQKLVERCCFKSGGARNKQKKGEKMRRELYIKRGALFEDAPARDLEALGEPFVEDRRTIGNTSASVRAYIEGKRRVHVRFSDPVERDIGDAWVEIPYECTAYFADRRRQEALHTPAVDSPQIQGLDAVDHICSMVTLLEKELNLQQVLIAKQSPTLKLEIEEALRLYRISQAIKIQCCVRIRQACAELQRRQRERERRQLSAVAIQSQARRVAGKKSHVAACSGLKTKARAGSDSNPSRCSPHQRSTKGREPQASLEQHESYSSHRTWHDRSGAATSSFARC